MTPTRDARAICQEIVDRNYFPESFTDDFKMLAYAYLDIEQKLRAAEKVVEAARAYFDEDISAGSKWNKKYFPRYHAVLDALKEFDALRDGGRDET